jgi:integrase
LPWKDAPAFIAELRMRQALAAKCLEFLILTAARSGEVLGATWGEIDLTKELWTIPAARMKAGAEHVVPLSDAAVQLLEEVRCNDPTPTAPVFAIKGVARSNMAMTMLLRRMERRDITVRACWASSNCPLCVTVGCRRPLVLGSEADNASTAT